MSAVRRSMMHWPVSRASTWCTRRRRARARTDDPLSVLGTVLSRWPQFALQRDDRSAEAARDLRQRVCRRESWTWRFSASSGIVAPGKAVADVEAAIDARDRTTEGRAYRRLGDREGAQPPRGTSWSNGLGSSLEPRGDTRRGRALLQRSRPHQHEGGQHREGHDGRCAARREAIPGQDGPDRGDHNSKGRAGKRRLSDAACDPRDGLAICRGGARAAASVSGQRARRAEQPPPKRATVSRARRQFRTTSSR